MALRTKCSSCFMDVRFDLCFVLLIWFIFLSVFLGKGDSLQLSLQSEFMIRKYTTFSSAIWVTAMYIYFKIYNYANSNSIFGVWILPLFFFTRKLLWTIMLLSLYREFWNFNSYMNFYVWITVCLKNAMYICYDHTHVWNFRPTPLILDAEGRTIDAKTGQTVQLTHHTPTLKVRSYLGYKLMHTVLQEKKQFLVLKLIRLIFS